MIKVSVVIPVYNAEKYLRQCIESLLNQTLSDIEIIFVDDGSTDKSAEIISKYAESDSRILLLRQKNKYAGSARNTGLDAAKGEYIIFLDADDFFDSDMLLEMYNKAVDDNADICLCSAKRFDNETGEVTYPAFYLNTSLVPDELPFSADDVKDKLFNLTSPSAWTKLFKTSFVKANKFRFQEIKKTNDLFFVYANLAYAERITYVNKPFVNYRFKNPESLQGEKNTLNLEFYDALMALKKMLQAAKLYAKFEKSFANRALSTCVYVLKSVTDKESFLKLAELLKNKYFFDFGIAGHTRAYFYCKADFDVFLDIIKLNAESLWNKYGQPAENTDFPLTDIDKLENTAEFSNNGDIKISVIVPVYNAEDYVEQCVKSIADNTLKDIEIICVNDGSTDNSLDVLKKLSQQDNRIVVVDKKNGGPSETRNAGIELARGEYISFIDSDDYIHEKTYEFLYSEAKKDNLDQIYFSAASFFDGEGIQHKYSAFDDLYKRRRDYSGLTSGRELFIKMTGNGEFRPSPCMLISKREFIEKNNLRFCNGLLHEDNLFIIQCLSFAERVRYVNANLYFRRVRYDSIMTGSFLIKRIYSYYKIIKILEQFAKDNNFGSDKAFFDAFKYQLSVMDFNACDIAENVSSDELNAFIDTLDEAEAVDFYNHINAVVRIRKRNKELSKRAKADSELALITEYRYSHFNQLLNDENKSLKTDKARLEQENRKLKSEISKKLVRFALQIDALLAKLRLRK